MKNLRKQVTLILALAMMLTACASAPKTEADSTQAEATQSIAAAAEETTEATEAPTEDPAEEIAKILPQELWKANMEGIICDLHFDQGTTGYFDGGFTFLFDWSVVGDTVELTYMINEEEVKDFYQFVDEDGVYYLKGKYNEDVVFAQASNFTRPTEYYEECNSLPTVDSCVGVRQAGKSTSTSNGALSKIIYRYEVETDEAAADVFAQYIQAVEENGLVSREVSETEYQLAKGSMVVATVSLDESGIILMDILPDANRFMFADEATQIAIGETITGDGFEFTLNKVELTYDVKPANTNGFYRHYEAEKGKVFIHVDGTYLNTSKRDVTIGDLFVPKADYDNGYNYEGFVVVDDGDNGFEYSNYQTVCVPLATCHYHGLIECPELIETSEAPLFVTFTIPGGMTYRIDIR